MALIVDSPWIPGYLGINHMGYYLDPELWFQSNLKIYEEFPDIIFFPSWWMEYGMAAEPSALGAKIKFWSNNTPSEYHTLFHLEDIDLFPDYEVEKRCIHGNDTSPNENAQTENPRCWAYYPSRDFAGTSLYCRICSKYNRFYD
jgi:hypothetical protein